VAQSNGTTANDHIVVVVGEGISGQTTTACPSAGEGPVLAVIDVSQVYTPGSPLTPKMVGFLPLVDQSGNPVTATDVTLYGSVALVSTGSNILLVNLENPAQPVLAGTISGDFGNWLAVNSTGLVIGALNGTVNGVQTAALGPYVSQVSFQGICPGTTPHGAGCFDVYNDQVADDQTGSAPLIQNPVWSLSNSNPVAYVAGQTIQLTVQVNMAGVPPASMQGMMITGSVVGLGSCTGPGTQTPNTQLYTASCTMSAPLPSGMTKFYNPMSISWTYKSNSIPSSPIGSTTTPVYVTLAPPLQTSATPPLNVYRTVLHLGVAKDGANSPSAALANSWSFFGDGTKPLNVTTWDGRPLIYYPAGVGFQGCATNDLQLLTSPTGGGRCGAFAMLMQDVLAVNGIQSSIVDVAPIEDTGMLIKNWDFSTTPSFPGSPYPYKFIASGQYINEMVPVPPGGVYGDLISTPGVPGQNSPTPSEKAHVNHAIILSAISPTYYDPSYGLTYTGPDNFEDQAVIGYFFHMQGDPVQVSHVRKSAGLHLISFTVY
jgi:hypothetical protein